MTLVWAAQFDRIEDAFRSEKQESTRPRSLPTAHRPRVGALTRLGALRGFRGFDDVRRWRASLLNHRRTLRSPCASLLNHRRTLPSPPRLPRQPPGSAEDPGERMPPCQPPIPPSKSTVW